MNSLPKIVFKSARPISRPYDYPMVIKLIVVKYGISKPLANTRSSITFYSSFVELSMKHKEDDQTAYQGRNSKGEDLIGDGRLYHHRCTFILQHNCKEIASTLFDSNTVSLPPIDVIFSWIMRYQKSKREGYIATLKATFPLFKFEMGEASQTSKRRVVKHPELAVVLIFMLNNRDGNNPRPKVKG
ncbi:hypothetical protein Cgig2_026007 [Carnegiea gigantea]|uniref:Uncharacterized protein n=1 Tax=Carnegiea gigantea TaxID=171969 RepID=A0A9Q1QAP6_9CARY|nr:hypothetical protein Cgig2_026007 [Carnegiea gigantea]